MNKYTSDEIVVLGTALGLILERSFFGFLFCLCFRSPLLFFGEVVQSFSGSLGKKSSGPKWSLQTFHRCVSSGGVFTSALRTVSQSFLTSPSKEGKVWKLLCFRVARVHLFAHPGNTHLLIAKSKQSSKVRRSVTNSGPWSNNNAGREEEGAGRGGCWERA